jgi:heme/copper-type cytochrome/quinol oxidase subunit 1
MSGGTVTPSAGNDVEEDDWAGFLMLGLAQLVTIFAIWMGLWPTAFGITAGSSLAKALAALFTLGGALGFFLAFRALSLQGQPET